jgi:hypothetical protein
MSRETGIDLKMFFRPEEVRSHADKKYSDSEIAFYYKKLQNLCADRNIRFSTCYIGNGIKDYFKYQDLWTNKDDCCDAKGNVKGITTSSQKVPWEFRLKEAGCSEEAKRSQALDSQTEQAFLDKKASPVFLRTSKTIWK